MLDLEVKTWDYTMDGNDFEAMMEIARGMKNRIYSRICNLSRSSGPDLSQDEDYLELRNLTDRIYREKDKTTEYWETEMKRLGDKLKIKLGIKAQ
jgi:hypothetical protein